MNFQVHCICYEKAVSGFHLDVYSTVLFFSKERETDKTKKTFDFWWEGLKQIKLIRQDITAFVRYTTLEGEIDTIAKFTF